MKILTIVGARPQFIKAAMVSRAIMKYNANAPAVCLTEEILHTGQHYDESMSRIFFDQMGIPAPVVNLHVGSGSHGAMTARMLEGIERAMIDRKPDWLLVYGDTNSTLAGALAAAKMHIPIVHVEAGLRSFNRQMPEEVNRVLADHLSALLLCPTHAAIENLSREGIAKGVHHVGDVMYDAALAFGDIAEQESKIMEDLGIASREYLLATVHRAENTDDPDRMHSILEAFAELSLPVIFPVHPRTKVKITEMQTKHSFARAGNLHCIAPVSYLDMVRLEKHAKCVLTDSGGVQKEAYFHKVPCVTLRSETEWGETVSAGWNQVVGTSRDAIVSAVHSAKDGAVITEYGDGDCAMKIIEVIRSA